MSAEIECPVCESSIPSDSGKCPECGVDLSLFDIEDSEASIESEDDIEEIMGKLIDDDEDLELLQEIKGLNGDDIEEDEESEEELTDETEEILMFACPICDAEVSEYATECPQCGAIFEEDEDEEPVEEEISVEEPVQEEALDEKSKELTEGIDRIKSMLSDIQSAKIDNTAFKDQMDDLVDIAKSGDYDEGLKLLNELEEMGERILKIDEILSDVNSTIKDIPDDIDVSEQLEKLDMVMDLGEDGDYSSALIKAEEIVGELEEKKSSELKKLDEEVKGKLKEARTSLSEARGTKINIDDIKELMRMAVKDKKEGSLKEAIEGFEDVAKWSDKVVDLYDLLLENKKKIKELKDEGLEYKKYITDLKESKSKADGGNYTDAENLLKELSEELQSESKEAEEKAEAEEEAEVEEAEEKAEADDRLKEEFRERVSGLKTKVSKAKDTSVEITPLKSLVSEIKDVGLSGDFEEALSKIDEVDQIFDSIIKIDEKIESLDDRIQELSESGFETEGFEEELEKVVSLADRGEYKDGIELSDEISKNISEFVEKKKKEEELEKEEIKDQFDKKLSEARSKLSEARDLKLNIDVLKNLLRGAVKAGNQEDYEHGFEKLETLNEKYEVLQDIYGKIEEGKELIRQLKNEEIEYNKYIGELKKGKLKTDEGDYEVSLSMINETINSIKEDLEDAELEEDIPSPEEIESEVEAELKKVDVEESLDKEEEMEDSFPSEEEIEAEIEAEIGAEIDAELMEAEKQVSIDEDMESIGEEIPSEEVIEEPSVEEEKAEGIPDKELYMEDIENLTSEIRSMIKLAKQNDYILEGGKEIIDKAIESTRRNDYETAYDLLSEGKESVEEEFEGILEEAIVDIELTLEEHGDEKDLDDTQMSISEIRSQVEEGDFESAVEQLNEIEDELTTTKGPGQEIQEKIDRTEKVLKDAQYVGIDIEQAMELLERAKKEKKVGNYIEAEDLAKDAKNKVLDFVPDFMNDKLSKAKKDLMKAKIVGTDVSKPIDLLKQANFAKKNEEFEDCLHYIKMFEEEMNERKG